jgi:hypothetical protein
MLNRRTILKSLAGVAAAGAVPTIAAVPVAQLAPEDVIVISHPGLLSDKQRHNIEHECGRVFAGRRVIVLDEGMTMQIARGLRTVNEARTLEGLPTL